MFSTHAARHCHSFSLLSRSLASLRTPAIRHASLKTLVRPQRIVQQSLPAARRYASQNAVTAASKAQLNRVIASLDLLNVYQGGQIRTVLVGMSRIVTIVVWGLGITIVAPRMFFDPDTSMWWVPAVAIGSGIPFIALALLSAPYVTAIRILLPARAKRNHEALMAFAEHVPPETKVSIQSMRWLPWPTHKEAFFADLRRLPGARVSANLEHVPLGHTQAQNASKIFGGRLAMRVYGRYWVDMTARNKSRAPGVWEKMWDQITIKGQEASKVAPVDRKPPVMANRSMPVSPSVGAAKKSPPPPPPRVRSKVGRSRK